MKSSTYLKLNTLLAAAALAATPHAVAEEVTVSGPLTGVVQWTRDNTYILDKFVYVMDGAELHIEPGTVIKALAGTDADTSGLLVTQGGKLFAEGTPTQPIIFTAEEDEVDDPEFLDLFDRGLWGGVLLMGKAPINTATNPDGNVASPKYDVFEGLPDLELNGQRVHRYGGADPQDSSGVLRYVSIRRAGTTFAPNKELNGLTLAGVGNGTTVEFVETYCTADDGFEFFGGSVNTKYLVSAFNDDDCFDTDQGHNGKHQFWFAIQEPGRKDNGAELNGEPNEVNAGNEPLANFKIWNATWIGAGADASGNRGFTIRVYAAPEVYNSVITEFGGVAMRITDDKSGDMVATGPLDFRENIWFGFNADPIWNDEYAQVFFEDGSRMNQVIDPMLRGVSRDADGGLDPRPAPDSPALVPSSLTPPNDGFYTPVSYRGAFDSDELWIDGWTFLSQRGFIAPRGNNEIVVTGPLTGVVRWTRDNTYILDKFVYVMDGAELHIEPGTVIKALAGTDADTSGLLVTQGGKLFAEGTPTQPIIFTAEEDEVDDPEFLDLFDRGLWGGVLLMGKAPINTATNPDGNVASPKYDVFEGLPDLELNGQRVHRYGGADPQDSSGVLRYVSIRRAGTTFAPNKELNGLTLAGVGNGTTVEFVETYCTADDGFEFFGGSVNTKYLVSAFNDDDCFDTDQGHNGKHQFWFAIQEPGRKDNGAELNGEPNEVNAGNEPLANFKIWNATWIGAGADASGNRGFTIRVYAAPEVYNSVITEFGGVAMRITDDKSGDMVATGPLDFRENIWFGFNADPIWNDEYAQVFFEDGSRMNQVIDPKLRGVSRDADGGLDPRPAEDSPALVPSSLTPPNDCFYTPVNYRGAFAEQNWLSDWTFLSAVGIASAAGGGNPMPLVCSQGPVEPELTIAIANSQILITFDSENGVTYQTQSVAALGGAWQNAGAALQGNGGELNYTEALGAGNKFFRVIIP